MLIRINIEFFYVANFHLNKPLYTIGFPIENCPTYLYIRIEN